jgi:hypothetical protein
MRTGAACRAASERREMHEIPERPLEEHTSHGWHRNDQHGQQQPNDFLLHGLGRKTLGMLTGDVKASHWICCGMLQAV